MASTITITFNSQPAENSEISFSDAYTGIGYLITFKNPAQNPRIQLTSNVGAGVGQSAQYFAQAFDADYNTSLIYSYLISISPTAFVTIKGVGQGKSQFTELTNTTAGAVTMTIANDAPPVSFVWVETLVQPATTGTVCNDVKLSLETTEQADAITSPISQAVATNPFVFETQRGGNFDVVLTKSGYTSLTKTFRIPKLLSAYIDIQLVNTPAGATLTVKRLYPLSNTGLQAGVIFPLTFTYSLDDINYQSSNSWSGLEIGSYTVYILDNLGCKINVDFEVAAFTPNLVDFDPIVEVSKANAFSFKKNEAWANCGIRKNITNTLSFEEQVDLNRRDYVQLFQTCDTINVQFKSNYETNTAKLVDCDGVEIPITVSPTTENMNVTDVRDGTVLENLNTGALGIRFGAGLTYDSITLLENGSYNLGQEIMSWINVGDYINIAGAGWCYVSEILPPLLEGDYYKIWTTTQHNGAYSVNEVVKVTTIYNVVDYNRFEFSVNMAALLGDYYLVINSTDPSFNDCEFISEWFNVAVEQNCEHHVINYYNSKNNEINYATGVTFKLRLPYVKNLVWKPSDEQEIYITDTKTVLLETRLREQYEISFMPLPTAMAQKAVIALSHDRLQIDGLNYVRDGEPEITQFGATNLYLVKATLVRSDYVFSNTGGTSAGEILLGSGVPLAIDSSQDGLLFIE